METDNLKFWYDMETANFYSSFQNCKFLAEQKGQQKQGTIPFVFKLEIQKTEY